MQQFFHHPELWLPGAAAMVCLAFASAFCSASETALFYLSHDDLRTMRVGRLRERAAALLLADPERLLTAVLFWNLLVNLSYFALSVDVAQKLARAGHEAAAGFFTLAALFVLILFGEVLPKSVATYFQRRMAAWVSLPMTAMVRALDPLIPHLRRITLLAQRTFWPRLVREPTLRAADLERAVEASQASAEIVRHERQVLQNILDLSDIPIEEIMRPRGAYLVCTPPVRPADLQGEVPAGDCVMLRAEGSEEFLGAVPLADFSELPKHGLEQAAEEIVYVPWCAKLSYVLQLLRDRFCTVAAVVNEYGETIGIVTYEDIVDSILLSGPSRAKRILRREPVLETSPGVFQVDGITTLRHFCRQLEIPYDPETDAGGTVAGMLFERLERLPEVGDECLWRGCRLRVIEVAGRGRVRVTVSRAEAPSWK